MHTLTRAAALLAAGVVGGLVAIGASRNVFAAGVPQTMAYQARLTDANNIPITGTFGMQLGIFTAAAGGEALCSEAHTQVNVLDGTFQIVVGTGTPAGGRPGCSAKLGEIFAGGAQAFLQVDVDGEGLTPRAEIHSVGQAFHAGVADRATLADRASTADNGVPAGTVVAYAGAQIPTGWLACDGAILDPTMQPQFAALRAAIGDSWGNGGDLSGPKFAVPDLRGRFMRGADDGSNNDPDRAARSESAAGSARAGVGSFQPSAVVHHSHGVNDPGHAHDEYTEGDGCIGEKFLARRGPGSCVYANRTGASGTGISIQSFGSSDETRPSNVAVEYIIKF